MKMYIHEQKILNTCTNEIFGWQDTSCDRQEKFTIGTKVILFGAFCI